MIVSRLRLVMEKLISPNQAIFVPGRKILDNVIEVQKMLKHYNNSKSKKGMVMWKIDFKKTYDRLK